MRHEIWGPSNGSTLIRVERNQHGRIVVHAQTDFGEAKCHLHDEGARKLRDALDDMLK